MEFNNESKKYLVKLDELINEWSKIGEINESNFEEAINGNQRIIDYLKKLESIYNSSKNEPDIEFLDWIKKTKVVCSLFLKLLKIKKWQGNN